MKHTEPPNIPHPHSPEELHNLDVAHEHSDIDVRAVFFFAASLVVIAVVSAAVTVGVFRVFENMAAANDPKLGPHAMPPTDMPKRTTESPYFGGAPQPQLITNEPAVLQQLRQSEAEQLHGYGWVDQPAGVARMPIDEAKKLILERGVPARAGGSIDPSIGTHAPAFGESSGGRIISAKPKESAGATEAAPSTGPGAARPVPHR
jgi:hypothetical protein